MPPSRFRLPLLVAALLLAATAFAPSSQSARRTIDALLDDDNAQSALWGISVTNLSTGQSLYSTNADKVFLPASNLKLFTTATALDHLGSAYRYRTTLYFKGQVQSDSVLYGDLVIRGSGDPTFGSAYFPGDPLREWAQSLRAMGVTKVRGRIIGDDDVFSDEPYAEGWDVSLVERASYATEAGGLSYRDNLLDIQIEGTPGTPTVRQEPPGYATVDNDARTARGGVTFRRAIGTNEVYLGGSVRPGSRGTVRLPVHNPTQFTIHAFAIALRRAGIQVSARLYDVDTLPSGGNYDYQYAEPLLTYISPPLADLIAHVNKRSDNFYAEQVFRTLGGGTTEGGARRVKALLREAGAATDGLSIADGSGLSRKDLITSASMSALLVHMYRHPERDAFLASLPAGGEARSTLRGRLGGVSLKAKTGSIAYARALSGYLVTEDGTPLAFSMMANNFTVPPYQIRAVQDRILQALATD